MMNFNLKNMHANLNYIHVIPHELHIFMQYKGGKFDIAHVGVCMGMDMLYTRYLVVNKIETSRKKPHAFLVCILYVFLQALTGQSHSLWDFFNMQLCACETYESKKSNPHTCIVELL